MRSDAKPKVYPSAILGKLKVELKPVAPTEVMVSREKARAFKEWLDGVR